MIKPVRFDDSLPRALDAISSLLDAKALETGVVLRDTTGRLAFFAATELERPVTERLADQLRAALGPYARRERIVVVPSDAGARSILEDESVVKFSISGRTVRLLDRRLVGADWLRPLSAAESNPPRYVFASLKGGVGRSTALSVVAAHLAGRGGRILTVDLDLEAPGLGPFLLTADTMPEFGMLDALVENNLGLLDDDFYGDLVAPSSLALAGGRIDVVPAYGKRCLAEPAEILAKLARAYAEDIQQDGSVATILDQVRVIVDKLAVPERYDAVLVDVRAGLHETTASALLGLGADVFLFGMDEHQTFHGYSALLAHLSRYVSPQAVPEWVDRLTPVHAKASADATVRREFVSRWRALVGNWGPAHGRNATVQPPAEFHDVPWNEDVGDDEALPPDWSILQPLAVLHSDQYIGFDPTKRRDLLENSVYCGVFGELVDRVESEVFPVEEEPA
jgi:hypothetical protein